MGLLAAHHAGKGRAVDYPFLRLAQHRRCRHGCSFLFREAKFAIIQEERIGDETGASSPGVVVLPTVRRSGFGADVAVVRPPLA